MERAGDELLARPGLAGDEHGGVRGADAGHELPHARHRLALADEISPVPEVAQLSLQPVVLAQDLGALRRAADRGEDRLGDERLADHVEGPGAHGRHGELDRGERGEDEDRHHGVGGAHLREERGAVPVGELLVEDDRVPAPGRERPPGLCGRARLGNLVPFGAQDLREDPPEIRLVVNQQHVSHGRPPIQR